MKSMTRGSVTLLVGSAIYAAYVYGFNAFIDDSLIVSVRETQLAAIDTSDPKVEQQISLITVLTTAPGFAVTIFFQLLLSGVFMIPFIAPFVRGNRAKA